MRSLVLIAGSAAALAIAAAVFASQPSANAAALPAPNPQREALAKARTEAARARERAALLDRQAQAARLASERATVAAAALAARVQQAEAALAGAEAELALVRQERRALDVRLARERGPITRLMAGLQSLVRRPVLLTLVQPGSIKDAVHMRAVIAAVQPQISARTASLRSALARAGALEREAARIAAQRLALRSDLLARRRDLAAESAAERIKAQRAASAADREAERAFAIGEQARDLSSLVRRLAAEPRAEGATPAPATRAPTALKSFRLPVSGSLALPADAGAGAVTVLPQPGALVVAPAAGRVAFAGPYRGYGAIVIIEHSGGWTSLVTGLAATQVVVGQALIAGSPLGQAASRQPQIGLELRRNGKRVNPLDQLR